MTEDRGRIKITKELVPEKGRTLSLGDKEVGLGDVRVDIDESTDPDVVADARNLPFEGESFDNVIFTEVIEHIPPPGDKEALEEIFRVLKPGGTLILSTPHDVPIYQYLDLAKLVMYHSSYSEEELTNMMKEIGYEVNNVFTAGGRFTCIANLWYCGVTYPLEKIFGFNLDFAPDFLLERKYKEYEDGSSSKGYTIFVEAQKPDE